MIRSLNTYRGPAFRKESFRAAGRSGLRRETAYDERTEGDPGRRVPKAAVMSFRTVLFMLVLIAAMTVALIMYIKLQSDVTSTSREIADLERQLTELKSQNDAAYNEINDSMNLEEVRKKAVDELGMKYADRDQIVIYSGEEPDSVHQVSDVDGR